MKQTIMAGDSYNPNMNRTLSKSRNRFAIQVLSMTLVLFGGCGENQGLAGGGTQSTYMFQKGSSPIWIQQFAATNLPASPGISVTTEEITSLSSDSSGNVIAAGFDLGSFNGYANSNHVASNFLASYSSSGGTNWIQQFGTVSGDFLQAVAVDSSGFIYAAGITLGTLSGYSGTASRPSGVIYKFTSAGALVWQSEFNVQGSSTNVSAISITSLGTVIIAGTFAPQGSQPGANLFVAGFGSTTGNSIWTSQFGVSALDSVGGLATDLSGFIYVTGATSGPFPGQVSGSTTPFLLKLTPQGSTVWTVIPQLSGESITAPLSVAYSLFSGTVIVCGAASNQIVSRGSQADASDVGFVASFTASTGSQNWATFVKSGFGDELSSVSTGADGTIYAAGMSNGLLADGFSQPQDDLIFVSFTSNGSPQSALQFGTGQIVNQTVTAGPQLTLAPSGKIYFAGPVQTAFPGFSNPSQSLQMFVSRLK